MKAQTLKTEHFQPDAENSTTQKIEVVTFNKTKIQCCIDPDGQIYVAIKPICDAIGIHTQKAYSSIKSDPILGAIHTVRYVLDGQNRKFPMQTIPIEFVHGWLFSIDASKVSANAKPKLLEFKKECYKVLFDHFFGKYQVYEKNLNERRRIEQLINELSAERQEMLNKMNALKKQLKDIHDDEISGQLSLNIKS